MTLWPSPPLSSCNSDVLQGDWSKRVNKSILPDHKGQAQKAIAKETDGTRATEERIRKNRRIEVRHNRSSKKKVQEKRPKQASILTKGKPVIICLSDKNIAVYRFVCYQHTIIK